MNPKSTPTAAEFAAIVAQFALYGRFLEAAPHGSGHINDTFAVVMDQAGARVRYILQRINTRIFRDVDGLMDNIRRVTEHAAASTDDGARSTLTLISARDGQPFVRDEQGAAWRCYLFIEGARTYDLVETPEQAYEAARAFGRFQRLVANVPGRRLKETIPDFHHTPTRFANLVRVAANDPLGRAAAIRAEIDFALERQPITRVLQDLKSAGAIPERITHNDTKFNNVMLDDATGRAVCVIDLDTVMPGLALDDFGDMVRSATNAATEDEIDLSRVTMRMPVYERLVAGYLAGTGGMLNPVERAHLAFAGKLITFEIGIRFLTDYLEGDVYFKIKRPTHNLDRARNQFALVRSIEAQEPAMAAVVDKIAEAA
jgi:aminoglycoside phosphotransferase (APT) family kinase protein